MQENSPSEVSATSSADLKNFTLRVAQGKEEDLITEADFEMFKALKFTALDLDFLQSISVLPPTNWKEINNFCTSILELLIWHSDNCANSEKSELAPLIKCDCFLCMCQSPSLEFKIVFLQRLCRSNQLQVKDYIIRKFASCIEFTEDSLSFNFLNHYFLPSGEYALFFCRILEYFHNYQLKSLSISYLSNEALLINSHSSPLLLRSEICNLIHSNSTSLITLELLDVSYKYESTQKQDLCVHLPNLQRLVASNPESLQLLKNITFGMEITWFGVPISRLYPKVNRNVVSFGNRNDKSIDTDNLLEFLQVFPNLTCLILDGNGLNSSEEVKNALKSLVSLKKVVIKVDEKVEDYIGSKVVESLEFSQKKAPFANWNFISSLERLTKLTIGVDFKPEEAFFEFLKLDRLELLSIRNLLFVDEVQEKFFQTMKPLKNLKTLKLYFKYIQNAVLSENIETLDLWWRDKDSDYHYNTNENFDDFIRGPGVKYLHMYYEDYVHYIGSVFCDYFVPYPEYLDFIPTKDLKRFFPKLERVKAAFVDDYEEHEEYEKVENFEPLCKDVW